MVWLGLARGGAGWLRGARAGWGKAACWVVAEGCCGAAAGLARGGEGLVEGG